MKKFFISSIAVAAIITNANAGKNVAPVETPPVPVQQPVANSFKLVGLQIGTLGVGANFAMPINKNLQARLNINGLKVNKTKSKDGIKYNASLKLFTAGLLLDYYPWESSTFHISTGAYYDNNKVTGNAVRASGAYTVNGHTYQEDIVKRIDADLKFNKFAPYLGLGWGGKLNSSGWSWNLDIGVMYHGKPEFKLTPYKGADANSYINIWNQAVNDIKQQEATTQSDVKKYKFYPVVSVGFIYRF